MGVHWHAYPDPKAAAEACAHHLIARLEEALSGQEYATLAFSGGYTPRHLFERLAASAFPWNRVHLFWVDERVVPPTDPASNYRLVAENFLLPAQVPSRNIHRIHGELMPDVAAKRYATEIREFFGLSEGEMPHFDAMHRGLGISGDTASLFPGEPLLEDRENLAAAVYVEKLAQWRITLLPGVLLAAKHTVILVTGKDKAEIVRTVLSEPYDPRQYPAQMISHHGRGVAWFLDNAAASLIEPD